MLLKFPARSLQPLRLTSKRLEIFVELGELRFRRIRAAQFIKRLTDGERSGRAHGNLLQLQRGYGRPAHGHVRQNRDTGDDGRAKTSDCDNFEVSVPVGSIEGAVHDASPAERG